MLQFTNIEGSKYNPVIDNYLVIQVNNYANTGIDEIKSLVDCIERSHDNLVMVETESHGLDLINFLENIGKIVIFKVDQKLGSYYLTVQKSFF